MSHTPFQDPTNPEWDMRVQSEEDAKDIIEEELSLPQRTLQHWGRIGVALHQPLAMQVFILERWCMGSQYFLTTLGSRVLRPIRFRLGIDYGTTTQTSHTWLKDHSLESYNKSGVLHVRDTLFFEHKLLFLEIKAHLYSKA